MFKNAFAWVAAVGYVVAAVVQRVEEQNGGTPGNGAAKKEQALTMLMAQLAPLMPDFLEGLLKSLLSMLIDWAVAEANGGGFFKKPATA